MRQLPMMDERHGGGEPPVFERVAVVGCGLIGGSLAMAVKRRWPRALVIAVDRRPVLETAMRLHAVDVGADDLVMAAEADLIVLAAPVRQNDAILESLAAHVPGSAVVTDVGSTKRTTVAAASRLPARLRFVGGHPFAGAAVSGVEAARPDLFDGRPWLLTTDGAAEEDLQRIEAFVTGVGAWPRRLTVEAHDLLFAYLSHLPQLTASALMHVVGEHAGGALDLAGRGLRDTTRLASSPPDIWRDVLATNRDNVVAALDALMAALTALRDDAQAGAEVERIFTSAARWRAGMDGS